MSINRKLQKHQYKANSMTRPLILFRRIGKLSQCINNNFPNIVYNISNNKNISNDDNNNNDDDNSNDDNNSNNNNNISNDDNNNNNNNNNSNNDNKYSCNNSK